MCPCFGARRVIVDGGSGREQTVLTTFGSQGACVGVDFSFTVLLFPHFFYIYFFRFVLRRVVVVAFQLLSFFFLRFSFSGFVFFPLIVGTLLMAQYLRFASCRRCGGLRA